MASGAKSIEETMVGISFAVTSLAPMNQKWSIFFNKLWVCF